MTTSTARVPAGIVPRPRVYDLYWYFAAERQAIFERRLQGSPGPWTDDRILRTFKFCNVFRAADRVSQYMIRKVCYHGESCSPQDRLFQIVAFRTFSKEATWEGLRERLGRYPLLRDLADGSFLAALDDVRAVSGGLYTGAFILCATDAYGQGLKHRNHAELFKHMFLLEDLADQMLEAQTLGEIYHRLKRFPLMGAFMSYQTAIDVNYSAEIVFSENDFTQAGPGALRGIRKAFLDTGRLSPTEIIQWMVANQEREFERLDLPFGGLFGRPLHAIDCQGLFCELDKYCREAAPDLSSARKRIKARFAPSSRVEPLFFPPKWQLAVPEVQVARDRPSSEMQPTLF
ncbi:MAG: nucleotide kinase domain-containing protein [Pseudonocardia sp.]